MLYYIARRVGLAVLTVLAVSVLSFSTSRILDESSMFNLLIHVTSKTFCQGNNRLPPHRPTLLSHTGPFPNRHISPTGTLLPLCGTPSGTAFFYPQSRSDLFSLYTPGGLPRRTDAVTGPFGEDRAGERPALERPIHTAAPRRRTAVNGDVCIILNGRIGETP